MTPRLPWCFGWAVWGRVCTSCTVLTLGAIHLWSILTDRPVAMLSAERLKCDPSLLCNQKKKKKRRPTPVTLNSSISSLANGDFTLTVHPELCSCLTRSWAGASSWQILLASCSQFCHPFLSAVSFFFYRDPRLFVIHFVLWLSLF